MLFCIVSIDACTRKNVVDKSAILYDEGAKSMALCWFIFVFVIMFCFFKEQIGTGL